MIKREILIDLSNEDGIKKAILKIKIFGFCIYCKNIIDQFYFNGDGILVSTKNIRPNTKIYTSYEYSVDQIGVTSK